MALSRPRYATMPDPYADPIWASKPATEADVRWLSHRLTAGAMDEIEAISRFQPISALLQDLKNKRVVYDDRRPTQPDALFYVHPYEGTDAAGFWCATTERLATSEGLWSFTSYASSLIDHFNTLYSTLLCAVDARNIRQMQLVERLGFKLFNSVPQYGRKDMPFHFYSRKVNLPDV